MNEPGPDPAVLVADDVLLDNLGARRRVTHEPVTVLLAAWRADLDRVNPGATRSRHATVSGGAARRRMTRRVAAVTVVAAVVAGLIVVASRGPDGIFWPITRILYRDRAPEIQDQPTPSPSSPGGGPSSGAPTPGVPETTQPSPLAGQPPDGQSPPRLSGFSPVAPDAGLPAVPVPSVDAPRLSPLPVPALTGPPIG